ncbi:MAG TPA: hypothetical protein VGT41_06050 [Candidatus Babeliales bacterium]|nr:hypothetical protein [Candidatus Babeliales bacterium]
MKYAQLLLFTIPALILSSHASLHSAADTDQKAPLTEARKYLNVTLQENLKKIRLESFISTQIAFARMANQSQDRLREIGSFFEKEHNEITDLKNPRWSCYRECLADQVAHARAIIDDTDSSGLTTSSSDVEVHNESVIVATECWKKVLNQKVPFSKVLFPTVIPQGPLPVIIINTIARPSYIKGTVYTHPGIGAAVYTLMTLVERQRKTTVGSFLKWVSAAHCTVSMLHNLQECHRWAKVYEKRRAKYERSMSPLLKQLINKK